MSCATTCLCLSRCYVCLLRCYVCLLRCYVCLLRRYVLLDGRGICLDTDIQQVRSFGSEGPASSGSRGFYKPPSQFDDDTDNDDGGGMHEVSVCATDTHANCWIIPPECSLRVS